MITVDIVVHPHFIYISHIESSYMHTYTVSQPSCIFTCTALILRPVPEIEHFQQSEQYLLNDNCRHSHTSSFHIQSRHTCIHIQSYSRKTVILCIAFSVSFKVLTCAQSLTYTYSLTAVIHLHTFSLDITSRSRNRTFSTVGTILIVR